MTVVSTGVASGTASRILLTATLVLAGFGLSACQNKTASLESDPIKTASTSLAAEGPSFKRTEKLSKLWNANPADMKTGLAYADSLGALGQAELAPRSGGDL